MRVYIDDTQLQDSDSIDHAIDLARAHAQTAGRLIVDITADGAPASPDLLESAASSVDELRFATLDTITFLAETTQTADESIALLKADQSTCATQIRAGELESAMQSLLAIMEGWHAVRDVVDQVTQLAEIDITTLAVDDTTGAELTAGLSQALNEVRESLQTQDWATLGDIVEYDLDTHATRWSALLSVLGNHIKRA